MATNNKGARPRNTLLDEVERIRRGFVTPAGALPQPKPEPASAFAPANAAAPRTAKRTKRSPTFERMRAELLSKGRDRCLNEKREALAAELSPHFRGPKKRPLTASDYSFKLALGSINDETEQMLAEGKPIT